VHRTYSKDIYKKEPIGIILLSFLCGGLSIIPAALLEVLFEIKSKTTMGLMAENFIIVALTEELCKFFVIRFIPYRNINFDEFVDGAVYGAAVGGGFATFENVFYVMEHGFEVGLMRAVLSVPMHVFTGALIGHYLASVKFQKNTLIPALMKGLLVAVLVHGFFDYVITLGGSNVFLIIPAVIGLGYWLNRCMKIALDYDKITFGFSDSTDELSVIDGTESKILESSDITYKMLRAGSLLLVFVFACAGLFLGLGAWMTFTENRSSFDEWFIIIPGTLFSIAGFFYYKSRQLKTKLANSIIRQGNVQ
jgi:hypothetical protein